MSKTMSSDQPRSQQEMLGELAKLREENSRLKEALFGPLRDIPGDSPDTLPANQTLEGEKALHHPPLFEDTQPPTERFDGQSALDSVEAFDLESTPAGASR